MKYLPYLCIIGAVIVTFSGNEESGFLSFLLIVAAMVIAAYHGE